MGDLMASTPSRATTTPAILFCKKQAHLFSSVSSLTQPNELIPAPLLLISKRIFPDMPSQHCNPSYSPSKSIPSALSSHFPPQKKPKQNNMSLEASVPPCTAREVRQLKSIALCQEQVFLQQLALTRTQPKAPRNSPGPPPPFLSTRGTFSTLLLFGTSLPETSGKVLQYLEEAASGQSMSLLCSTNLGNSPALPTGEAESTYHTQTALAYRKRLFIIIIIDHMLMLPREALHLYARSQCLMR